MTVFGRRHSYRLYTKLLTEASRWAGAIQTVIDSKAPIDTPTQQLIHDIKVRGLGLDSTERALAAAHPRHQGEGAWG